MSYLTDEESELLYSKIPRVAWAVVEHVEHIIARHRAAELVAASESSDKFTDMMPQRIEAETDRNEKQRLIGVMAGRRGAAIILRGRAAQIGVSDESV